MENYKILIVEDEIIIADTIKRYLIQSGYNVVGIAISYQEAKAIYLNEKPDIVLLDIRLSGQKTGIDFAVFIQEQSNPKPFVFLTSQLDSRSINRAKETFPAGYLSKPIQKNSLYTSIEIAMHNYQNQPKKQGEISLNNGIKNYSVPYDDILFLQANHIYVNVHTKSFGSVVQRGTLKEMLELLPEENFIQTHRSFVVNIDEVNHWDNQQLLVQKQSIPMSRKRRKEVVASIEKIKNDRSEHLGYRSEQN